MQKQVTSKITQMNPRDIPGEDKISKKEEEKKKKEEIAQLFKPVAQTVAKGVDPKSVVCVYFKQNLCQKGDKCKFSHDLNIERKSEKRNIYEDTRENAGDTMENWDEQKLEDVVNKKHGEDNVKKNQTQIVFTLYYLFLFSFIKNAFNFLNLPTLLISNSNILFLLNVRLFNL